MFDTSPEGILNIISQGESATVEFKQRFPPTDVIAKVLAAFANTNGGILLIGIADDGSIVGIPEHDVKSLIERLHRLASSLLGYPVQIGNVTIQGKSIIYAIVDKVPMHLGPVLSSKGEFLKRDGARIDNMKRAAPRCDITPGTKNNLKGGAAHGEKDSICRH